MASATSGPGRILLGPVELKNPVVAASGCVAYGRELGRFVDLADLGAIITKSIMKRPRPGRPTPRIVETPAGMINAIGLQGCGIDEFLAEHLPWLHRTGACVGVSIAGETPAEYVELAERVAESGLAAFLELNISCPNVASRDQVFACVPDAAADVVSRVRTAVGPDVPVFAKLSPDVTSIVGVARACTEAGADGLSLINTLLAASINPATLRPALPGLTGGLSGPAIHPIAVRAVWQVHHAMPHVPLLGGGGVTDGATALALLAAGASAVSVGTANFRDPRACLRIAGEIRDWMEGRGVEDVRTLVGAAHRREDLES